MRLVFLYQALSFSTPSAFICRCSGLYWMNGASAVLYHHRYTVCFTACSRTVWANRLRFILHSASFNLNSEHLPNWTAVMEQRSVKITLYGEKTTTLFFPAPWLKSLKFNVLYVFRQPHIKQCSARPLWPSPSRLSLPLLFVVKCFK